MSTIKLLGNASGTGTLTFTAPNTNTNRTITIPDADITLGGGKVLQVLQANTTTQTIVSSTTYSPITGMTISITPSSTSSKVLVMYDMGTRFTGADNGTRVMLRRNGATTELKDLGLTDYEGNVTSSNPYNHVSSMYLDSPTTTNTITYDVYGRTYDSGHGSSYFNNVGVGSIIVMEIGA